MMDQIQSLTTTLQAQITMVSKLQARIKELEAQLQTQKATDPCAYGSCVTCGRMIRAGRSVICGNCC